MAPSLGDDRVRWPWEPGIPSVAIACPRCKSLGATHQQEIIIPAADGSKTPAGDVYGCPYCSLLWGVQGGQVFELGCKRKDAVPALPNGPSPVPMDEQKRANLVQSDRDMRWRR